MIKRLFDLTIPPAPSNKNGWPWNENLRLQTPAISNDLMPKISIVTPSFNQGRFIEETIRAVLLQGYPNLEYIVIDGGSTDDTIGIIEKYSPWLLFWISEPDKGQSHAINKGFKHATGEIFGYINSDDIYEPGAFKAAAEAYQNGEQSGLLAGNCRICDPDLKPIRVFKAGWPNNPTHFLNPFSSTLPQPACFFSRNLYERVGGFDETLHYAFDQEFFLKAGLAYRAGPVFIDEILASYRDHSSVKTRETARFYEESLVILEKHGYPCGLSEKEIALRRRRVKNDIAYFRVFQIWKTMGRRAALNYFIKRAMRYPDFLSDRKVLGQARRLLMFKTEDVAEIN